MILKCILSFVAGIAVGIIAMCVWAFSDEEDIYEDFED